MPATTALAVPLASGTRSVCVGGHTASLFVPAACPRPRDSFQQIRAISSRDSASVRPAKQPANAQQLEPRQLEAQQHQQRAAAPVDQRAGAGGEPGVSAAVVAAVAAGVSCVPLLLPTAAASAVLSTLMPHSLQQQQAWQTLTWGCTAIGCASLGVTLVCTTRFLLSYNPALEQEVELRRWALPWRAVTLFDPLLQPLRRRFFGQTAPGDLDYAAVALLAVVCSLLECLVGKDGLLNDRIPDFALLQALQTLIVFQHGMLLPCWVIVVLRWGRVM
ncbi:branched-chain amino acid transporter [Micractinium conductrix]|uniref:Branched-chain amino acid transporter n=1 Tax=Micractinium conductrix TaxID=554055 RepID=A0A2P6V0K4_9CHLO|nr:branched-chain amino acid transporter [Micractinium conductrix]|eukprot:PSC67620.1 branched-chain amino acid transporter [Micractinium conductrix]